MSLHNDLQTVKIPHSCGNCCRRCSGFTVACSEFYPSNMTDFMEYAVSHLRERVVPSNDNKLKRRAVRDMNSYDDGITTLDGYYVQFINSVLSEIRRGKTDYVFSFEQIAELMRFEERLAVRYIPEVCSYEIRRDKEQM